VSLSEITVFTCLERFLEATSTDRDAIEARQILSKECEEWSVEDRVSVLVLLCNYQLNTYKLKAFIDETVESHDESRRALWNLRNERRKRVKAAKLKEAEALASAAAAANVDATTDEDGAKVNKAPIEKEKGKTGVKNSGGKGSEKELTEEEKEKLEAKDSEKEGKLEEELANLAEGIRWAEWGLDRAKRRYFVYDPQNVNYSGVLLAETPPGGLARYHEPKTSKAEAQTLAEARTLAEAHTLAEAQTLCLIGGTVAAAAPPKAKAKKEDAVPGKAPEAGQEEPADGVIGSVLVESGNVSAGTTEWQAYDALAPLTSALDKSSGAEEDLLKVCTGPNPRRTDPSAQPKGRSLIFSRY